MSAPPFASPLSLFSTAARVLGTVVFSFAAATATVSASENEGDLPETIAFNRDIRLILSDNCYNCHGPDKGTREARLRLDTAEGMLAERGGIAAVVPGDLDSSELYYRITAHDPDERMPPLDSNRELTDRDIALLKLWIEQGAPYEDHWSYIPPERPQPPEVEHEFTAETPIDPFILSRLQDRNLQPSPEADRATLIRRLSFDLTGLPPEPAKVEAFLQDESPDAYEKVVDRLLASPHFGERMAIKWLDLVRYADSIGYHSDNPRNVTPYRDYVINAFNQNMPFDQFTIEQLAGDLLPEASLSQKVASGYNRLIQSTEEGGAQPKEYEAKNSADRVRNVASVWLGSTLACAECHDHKFDPYSAKDFYSMAAFFADVKEDAIGRREEGMPVPSEEQVKRMNDLDAMIAELLKDIAAPAPRLAVAQAEWEEEMRTATDVEWEVLKAKTLHSTGGATLTILDDGSILASGENPARDTYTFEADITETEIAAIRLEALPHESFNEGGPGRSGNGNIVLTDVRLSGRIASDPESEGQPLEIETVSANFSQDTWPIANAIDGDNSTGWALLPETGKPHDAVFEFASGVELSGLTVTLDFQSPHAQHQLGRFRISATTAERPHGARGLPSEISQILAGNPEEQSDEDKARLQEYYRMHVSPELKSEREALAAAQTTREEVEQMAPRSLVTTAAEPRTVRVLPRGEWMNDTGEIVEPAVPHFMKQIEPNGDRATRLDLAQWLVDPENPRTARVFVNHLWNMFYGRGLTTPLDDLGSQGEWPEHLELIDWLAMEFIESGWDIKHMVRLMTTSRTYRQTSDTPGWLADADPLNRFFARQGSFQLAAEMVRDNVLSISGLLTETVGGPSIRPYQPEGYWDHLNFPRREYVTDEGDDQYRRGLYIHWQRSFLHPSLLAFNASPREECVAERPESNTPQQALVLLNDPTFVEAARVFAQRILTEGGVNAEDRIYWAFRRTLSREPTPEEQEIMEGLLTKHTNDYRENEDAATGLTSVGFAPMNGDLDVAQLAAWTSVARVLFNLHETITRR
ncbi:MAG: DUF1553 domain-containing protein [Opitutales bacterium]